MARKKLQKVFALLLTASMTMSLLSVTAFADKNGENGTSDSSNSPEVVEEHTHNDHNDGWYCQVVSEAPLTCGKEEHTHDDSCYEQILTCTKEEMEGHTHSLEAGCYELTCSEEESAGHTHDSSCYEEILICEDESEEHVHSDACYQEQLVCDQEESAGHTHSLADCYELTCEKEEMEGHAHDASCYDRGELLCDKEEHTHDDSCYGEVEYSCIHIEYDTATKTLTATGTGDFPEEEHSSGYWYSPALWHKNWYYQAENVVIGEGITSLPTNAFYGNTRLKSVSLPSTLTAIGAYAFNNCTALTSVTMAGTESDTADLVLKGVYLRELCFANSGLTSLHLTECSGGFYAFSDCAALSQVTMTDCNFEDEADGMFFGSAITTVAIDGGSVSRAFNECTSITQVTINGCELIGQDAFSGCTGIKNLTIENCGTIADWAFTSCTGLETLTLINCDEVKSSAFIHCSALKTLNVTGDTLIYGNAFQKCNALETVTLDGCTQIGSAAFANLPALKTVNISDTVRLIGNGAFEGCSALTGELDLSSVEQINARAFENCTSITKITVSPDVTLGYSNIFSSVLVDTNGNSMNDRIKGILDGSFEMSDAPEIHEIAPDGWTSSKVGYENAAEDYNDNTQITKEARWANTAKTTADVQVKAYYTVRPQMDFVFVLDCSNSMAGSTSSGNAKFYEMISKVIDVSDELLAEGPQDTRVAVTGYAGNGQSFTSGKFYTDIDELETYALSIEDEDSFTDFSGGLSEALKLVQSNGDRDTTVILISDGKPESSGTTPDSYYGYKEAEAIKNAGAQIFGVLQSTTNADAVKVMEKISTDGKCFASSDLEGFSKAVNDAIGAAFTTYTLVDTIDPAFTLDESSIRVSAGTYEVGKDEDGNTTITWTITGVPFTTHTMTFQEKLNQVDDSYPTGSFDTNEGDALLQGPEGGDPVNAVETPVLTRDEDDGGSSGGGGGGDRDDDDDDDPTDIPDENTPTTDLPDVPSTDLPDENTPTTDLPEEDVPMAEVPKTGDMTTLWLALSALSGTGLAGVTFLGRKKREEA